MSSLLNVAISGYGNAGQLHARLLAGRSGVHIVGIADPTPARREAAAKDHPGTILATRLDRLDMPVDLVVTASPPAFHEADTRIALTRHRANVLCEKPAVLNPLIGQQLATQAADSGLLLFPVHNYLYAKAFRRMRTLISTGTIGRIERLQIDIARIGAATGTLHWRPDWRHDPAAGGGILGDHGSHAIYLAESLIGSCAIAVSCTTTPGKRGAESTAVIDLMFEGGATAAIALTWEAVTRSNRYEVHGSDGNVALQAGTLTLTKSDSIQTWPTDDPARGGHASVSWTRALHTDLLDRISRSDLGVDLWQTAVHVADVIEAARASAESITRQQRARPVGSAAEASSAD